MALTDKLNAIADAIREKTGREDKMTLSQMPDEIIGIATSDGGASLPELENPASATDLAEGKELIDQNGNVVTGTLAAPALVGLSQTPDFVSQNSSGQVIVQSGLYDDDVPDLIVRKGTKFRTRVPLSEFGNATADQVAKGAMFTSSAGLLVEGTMETGGGGSSGGISPIITVETVIATVSATTGDVVHNFVKSIFPTLDSVEPCLFKVLIVKDIETAKQTNNSFLGSFATYYASATPNVQSLLLRYRSGAFNLAERKNTYDVHLTSGTEFYMVTIDMKGMWA